MTSQSWNWVRIWSLIRSYGFALDKDACPTTWFFAAWEQRSRDTTPLNCKRPNCTSGTVTATQILTGKPKYVRLGFQESMLAMGTLGDPCSRWTQQMRPSVFMELSLSGTSIVTEMTSSPGSPTTRIGFKVTQQKLSNFMNSDKQIVESVDVNQSEQSFPNA